MSKTVIQYVLDKLKELGVTDTFGVPGDFVYPVCDHICDDPDINWIECANELNASYAAEGYARTKGVGVVVSTYGPGELSTYAGLGGSHAENCKVVSLTGMPGLNEQAAGFRTHHMISDQQPNYELFIDMVKPLTAGGNGAAMITAENVVEETDRLISAMMYHSRPINFCFPRDQWNREAIIPEGWKASAQPVSNPDALDAVVREILYRISNAKKACILPGYLLNRYDCAKEGLELVEASGLPFFSGLQDKSVFPESHAQFGGFYLGRWVGLANNNVSDYVESCDCIVGLGPENHEFNNSFHTMQYDFKSTINIMPHKTRVGMATYEEVEMVDVLSKLAKEIQKRTDVIGLPYDSPLGIPSGSGEEKMDYTPFYERVQAFLKPNDIFVSDTAITAVLGVVKMKLPDNVQVEASTSWGSIGWGTPAILGNAIAARDRRCVIIAGEGGHQLTANEMGTFYRYGVKPIFLVVNNGGFHGERVTNRFPDEEYNDVAKWNFADIPAAMGCKDWFTARVTTLGELDAALKKAEEGDVGVYIEIVVDVNLVPEGGSWIYSLTGPLAGYSASRTWDGWIKDGREGMPKA
jgi:indolepyruvate decarboxylase